MIPQSPLMSNTDAHAAIIATIALEVLRRGPSLPEPIQFVRGIDYERIPAPHVAAAELAKGKRA